MSTEKNVQILKTARRCPSLPFEKIAASILGEEYVLSLVLCADTLSQKMNAAYRKKTYVPNVLSFPLSKTEGEIFINIRKAEKEARRLGTTTQKRVALLLVHGCYHLKGYDHSDTMEALEQKTLRKFRLL